jgi:hypothetical protein
MNSRSTSPWFRNFGILAVVGVLGAAIYYAHVKPKQQMPAVSMTTNSDNPFATFTPAHAAPSPTPVTPPPMPPAQVNFQRPYMNKMAGQESEAHKRWKEAYLSPISVKGPNDNLTEIPSKGLSGPQSISLTAAPPHSIFPGTFIRAILRVAINSDLPGPVEAEVSQNVRDSNTLTELLIPHGARIIGEYSNKLVLTQNRLLVTWTKLIFPNGAELAIPKWTGQDASGANGFADQVDNHNLKIWGPSILMSAIAAATAYATTPNNNYSPNNGYYYQNQNEAQQEATAAGIYGLSSRAQQQLNRKLNGIQPTITIREGYPIVVMVQSRWSFDGAYN